MLDKFQPHLGDYYLGLGAPNFSPLLRHGSIKVLGLGASYCAPALINWIGLGAFHALLRSVAILAQDIVVSRRFRTLL